ncbi:class I SAM-dependent methyltransferase [candidate division KSB1 bacterium]|nr:class I SAM-dependent methyltransferase [candidate division KSB1 bacterium]
MHTPPTKRCPVCASTRVEVFFELLEVPALCNLLWRSRKAARQCPRGDIKLAFCHACSFISNVAFDPTRLEYTQAYENSLHFSPLFQNYARSLAARLVERYNLRDRDIIEIGCGQGDFLSLLCALGNNRGVGFDPSYAGPTESPQATPRVKFIQDFYSERYAGYHGDFICCRHTLEHIQNPATILNTLRRAIGDRLNTVVFFEVPNALHTFRCRAIWDIIYEHCSYFAPGSLRRNFSTCGFRTASLTEEFAGQFLCIEALPAERTTELGCDPPNEAERLADDIASFAANFQNEAERWRKLLEQLRRLMRRIVVWGAGSKGVTFLNILGIQDEIEYVVDINPRKQDMYVAGTGQRIVAPEFLRRYRPEMVMVMNPIYKNEIRQIVDDLGLATEFFYV